MFHPFLWCQPPVTAARREQIQRQSSPERKFSSFEECLHHWVRVFIDIHFQRHTMPYVVFKPPSRLDCNTKSHGWNNLPKMWGHPQSDRLHRRRILNPAQHRQTFRPLIFANGQQKLYRPTSCLMRIFFQ